MNKILRKVVATNGDHSTKLIFSKFKRGTAKFEAYITMQIVGDGAAKVVLDCRRVTRGDFNPVFMREFMKTLQKYRIGLRVLLMDREFFSVDVVRVFFDARRRFLMPATRTDGIKAAIAEHAGGGRGAVSRYVMRSSEGAEATVTLIIARSKHYDDKDADILDRYVPFVTNLSARRGWIELCTLPEEYRRRCGIETAYRQIGEARPKTISRDHTLRMILFYVALFMYNAWAVENRPSGPEAGIKLAQVLVAIYNASGPAGTGPGPPEKFG